MSDLEKNVVWFSEMPHTPVGLLWVAHSPTGVVAIRFGGDAGSFAAETEGLTGHTAVYAPDQTTAVCEQLQTYFDGQRTTFDLSLRWDVMTPFQQKVLPLVHAIPYGRTRSYGDLAVELGDVGKSRAVGRANATNPLPIIVPCHRVLGRDGKLHGYGGGLENKAWLLRLEGSWLL